jgi:glycosyltransferase involved in cell wall biosynthesis
MPKIASLTTIYDEHYHALRGEEVKRNLSWGKRRDLFRCLESALGREVVVLSPPPKALDRRSPRWLPPVETKFSTHRQFFCANWDIPRLRVLLSWFFYAQHVARHVESGDVVVMDNYEVGQVFAVCWLRLRRKVVVILDYEDGAHLIPRLSARLANFVAEGIGRRLLRGAFLVHPGLERRLPPGLPVELTPGFLVPPEELAQPNSGEPVRFLYSGTLDSARGVELLLQTLDRLPQTGWRLDIAGFGPLSETVARAAAAPDWQGKVKFHGSLPQPAYQALLKECQVGLNCQMSNDPISEVTFPSKVFAYLSAGLLVLSSRASELERICGSACAYYAEDTPESLAKAMQDVIANFSAARTRADTRQALERYSIPGTGVRLKQLLARIGLP